MATTLRSAPAKRTNMINNDNTENLNPEMAQAQPEATESTQENAITDEVSPEAELLEQISAEKDKYLRLFAEFENFKRRTAKERMELFKTAGQEILVAMLPILDDFDRALAEIQKSEDDAMFKGVKLIHDKFRKTLEGKGLELLSIAAGDDFDPDTAEAITQIPAPNESLKGKIVDVVEKGYKLGDRIIRFPKVVVGQ
jgi:molecular chaperone GrpE